MLAAIRDTEIFFDIVGAGLQPELPVESGRIARSSEMVRERPIVFLPHGGPGADHMFFRPSMDVVGEYAQVIYWDHRGQGRSARGDVSKYVLDENVEDMEALRVHLGIEKIVSFGTSYGGMVAMAHAARYPNAVEKLLLVVTAAHGGFIKRAQEIVAERGTQSEREITEKLWAGELNSEEAMRDYFRGTWSLYSTTYDESKKDRNESALLRSILSPDALNRAFAPGGYLHTFDLRPELSSITVPTMILAGRHDWICAPEFSEEIHRIIPGSQLKIFEKSSHSLRGDEPEEFFTTIKDFITG